MPPPPLLGYNNNVRHRKRVFHIQTEDSGVGSPRIMTHLFADGGRIVKSTRTDYSEYLERDDMAVVVKNMMKEQHKGMFVALRSGALDEIIGFDETAAPASLSGPDSVLNKAASLLEGGAPGLKKDAGVMSSSKRTPMPSDAPKKPSTESSSSSSATIEISVDGEAQGDEDKAYAASRPASIFSVPPPNSSSIFGQGLDEKSLDDAILSYLAEDPVVETAPTGAKPDKVKTNPSNEKPRKK